MQLILLQKVTNLGNLGDLVDVKPGYGRNFLVPQGKAVPATESNKAEFEAKRAEYEAKAQAIHAEADARKAKLDGASVTIPANASTEGKLYGSVGARCLHRCRPAGQQERSHPGRRRLPQHRRVRRADPPARRRRDHRQGCRRRRSLIPRRKAWHHRRTGARKGARFVLWLRFVVSGHLWPTGWGWTMFHAHS